MFRLDVTSVLFALVPFVGLVVLSFVLEDELDLPLGAVAVPAAVAVEVALLVALTTLLICKFISEREVLMALKEALLVRGCSSDIVESNDAWPWSLNGSFHALEPLDLLADEDPIVWLLYWLFILLDFSSFSALILSTSSLFRFVGDCLSTAGRYIGLFKSLIPFTTLESMEEEWLNGTDRSVD
ncbi:hypothetical protein WICPIJ_000084 [Wickerhamomyces pijperi]|uniref:Uncharacterized protein n=1 Tax=Wickerhamomyces pijperi TaxID=599730 RepID=A0A9P8TTA2_WICPI|nr:hypothetical protein WICPIJ_000084 [Wickerhamomyces pijperi]